MYICVLGDIFYQVALRRDLCPFLGTLEDDHLSKNVPTTNQMMVLTMMGKKIMMVTAMAAMVVLIVIVKNLMILLIRRILRSLQQLTLLRLKLVIEMTATTS